ncbi:hypothetical protein [Acuticoccus sediminis]|uniref:hypothetical protein n=1 Tax=Acuticoccus sediminis TaxID=2184697 RepID=UPI001CFDE232|nr:hypothetical protein [Acuticoccus sediminis]
MALALGCASVCCILVAIGFAGYLLWPLVSTTGPSQSETTKGIAPALIAVFGAGIAGFAALYSATRQSTTAMQVAQYNATVLAQLNDIKIENDRSIFQLKSEVDFSLAVLKSQSDESLAKIKIMLDASQIANQELFGSASVYFHTLRSAAQVNWNDGQLASAEAGMIASARHLLNVDTEVRDMWLAFWGRAQDIYHAASAADSERRSNTIKELIIKKDGGIDLREMHRRLECAARTALEDVQTRAYAPT